MSEHTWTVTEADWYQAQGSPATEPGPPWAPIKLGTAGRDWMLVDRFDVYHDVKHDKLVGWFLHATEIPLVGNTVIGPGPVFEVSQHLDFDWPVRAVIPSFLDAIVFRGPAQGVTRSGSQFFLPPGADLWLSMGPAVTQNFGPLIPGSGAWGAVVHATTLEVGP